MSKRLEVLIADDEMAAVHRLARSERITVREWVRRTLRNALTENTTIDRETKLKALRKAGQYSFPTADIEQMLEESGRGRG